VPRQLSKNDNTSISAISFRRSEAECCHAISDEVSHEIRKLLGPDEGCISHGMPGWAAGNI